MTKIKRYHILFYTVEVEMGLELLNSIKDVTEKDQRFHSSKAWSISKDLEVLRVYYGVVIDNGEQMIQQPSYSV